MKLEDIPTDNPAFLVELLLEAQGVLANLMGLLALIAQASPEDAADTRRLCRAAANVISSAQRQEADVKRRANQIAEAKVIDEARKRFESLIDQLLAGGGARH